MAKPQELPAPGSAFKFTEARVAALPSPAPGARHVYRDTEARGLQLRVTAAGVKTFSIFRRIKGGRPERITLDRCPPMTVERARVEAAKANASIAAGGNPAEVRRAVKGEPTFADLFDAYLTRHAKPRKRTWREDEAKYRDYLSKPLGALRVSQVERKHVAAIMDKITRAGHPTMANRTVALVSSVFGWGVSVSLCEANPAKGVKHNRERSRDRFLTAAELPKFFEAVRDEPSATMRDYVLLSLLTGARRSNMLAMRWRDIDLEAGEWRIERTKNEDPAVVPLTAEAIAILAQRKPEDVKAEPYVFPGPGKRGHLQEPRKAWGRILKRAGIEDLRIHDLRRSLGSWQAKTGASLAIIGKSLQHKTASATAIYARLDMDPVRASVEKATSAMLEAAGVKKPGEVTPIRKKA